MPLVHHTVSYYKLTTWGQLRVDACVCCSLPVADVLVCLVEVLHVFRHHVAGSDVRAATKPPLARDAVPVLCLKVPGHISSNIHMLVTVPNPQ